MISRTATLLFVFSALLLQGCARKLLPQAPGADLVASVTTLEEGVTVEEMKPNGALKNRNLIFVAADDQSESLYDGFLKQAYPKQTPRLEEVAWWLYAPELRGLYDRVVRIRYDSFSKESLLFTLTEVEKLGDPYDVVFFTHGLPNNIVTSVGFPLFSWGDLDALAGKLPHLRLVFMQGCFGSSLVQDWVGAGAQAVISFPDLNRNYFYLGFFLKQLEASPEEIEKAFLATNQAIGDGIRGSELYTKMIDVLGVTVEEYLRASPNPDLALAPSNLTNRP